MIFGLFKQHALCPLCDNKLPKNPAILFVEDEEGKREIEICDECADIYENLAKDDDSDEPI